MKQRTLVALDIGTKSLKMAVAKIEEDGGLEILGVVEEPSSGVRKSVVVRPEEAAKRIVSLVRKAEQITSVHIEEVVVSLGGSRLFAVSSHGLVAVSRADGNISKEDVDRVLQAAQTFSLSQNQEILETYPTQYIVDGEEGIREPIGMKAVRLETDIIAVCLFSPDLKNLTDAVLEAGLEIIGVVPSPLAAAQVMLSAQEKEMGVAVVELGAGTTSLAVFEEGDLKHIVVLPVGAENITHDIAIGLRIEHDLAERIKTEFGTCLGSKGKRMEKIELQNGETFTFSSKFVGHIIEERVKEIFQLLNKELKKIGKQGQLPGGVVLCGGGAKLPKIAEFAKKELKLSVKIGNVKDLVTTQDDPAFLGVFGLLVGVMQDEKSASVIKKPSRIADFLKKLFKSFIP
ncbi:cell division protein FtsA [Patescibacteria group bacterium]|nr:cell division protein FtsA [Patescibacteria group bacterium]